MNTVTLGTVTLGEGMPKICVPLSELTQERIEEAAERVKYEPFDLLEWRVDHYEDPYNWQRVVEILGSLHEILPGKPILFTCRTRPEGGNTGRMPLQYLELNKSVIISGQADAIDIEMNTREEERTELLHIAKEHGVAVVLSYHDFDRTPEQQEMVELICKEAELGADIAKLAVMPKTPEDVLALLSATEQASQQVECPVITMSMGRMGRVSRVSGELFGSCLTFGAVGRGSAPGQIETAALKQMLSLFHQE